MKKSIRTFIGYTAIVLSACILSSCSEKIEDQFVDENPLESATKTCAMTFDGGVVGYDQGNGTTRATSTDWVDGDKLYITFYNEDVKVPGIATYSVAQGWNVSYDGDLAYGTGLQCEARYFVNTTFANESLVSLNTETEIYEAIDGTYDYDGTTLSVQALMTPKTGRIRFTGTPGEEIHLTGIATFTIYSPATNTFSNTKSMITTTVGETGYTPYIYGALSESNRKLSLVGSDFAYTRACGEEVLKVGDSGYMAIPTESSHNNWRSGLYVTVGDIEFKMIPVAGHADGFFLIGETEVTRGLYYEVIGSSTSTNLDFPIGSVSYGNFQSFITELNYQTDLSFALPTVSQWQYAAKGGNLSQGYTYSGSNNPGDVAWYEGNAQGSVHAVKQLAPNELGIYDMSGNAWEFTSSYGSYKNYTRCGGCCISDSSNIRWNYTSYDANTAYDYTANSYYGYRLILTCK